MTITIKLDDGRLCNDCPCKANHPNDGSTYCSMGYWDYANYDEQSNTKRPQVCINNHGI
jgi:hypothetical protein